MTWLRRLTQAVVSLSIMALGVLLILEATGVLTDAWRLSVADGLGELATETPIRWAYTLAGVAVAGVALLLATAQLMPARKGMSLVLPVSDGDNGDTRLRGKALIAAVDHRVHDIVGVVDSTTWLSPRAVTVQVRVDDRCDLEQLMAQLRDRLDHGFWIDLGVADLPVNLEVVHHPKPPRVR